MFLLRSTLLYFVSKYWILLSVALIYSASPKSWHDGKVSPNKKASYLCIVMGLFYPMDTNKLTIFYAWESRTHFYKGAKSSLDRNWVHFALDIKEQVLLHVVLKYATNIFIQFNSFHFNSNNCIVRKKENRFVFTEVFSEQAKLTKIHINKGMIYKFTNNNLNVQITLNKICLQSIIKSYNLKTIMISIFENQAHMHPPPPDTQRYTQHHAHKCLLIPSLPTQPSIHSQWATNHQWLTDWLIDWSINLLNWLIS